MNLMVLLYVYVHVDRMREWVYWIVLRVSEGVYFGGCRPDFSACFQFGMLSESKLQIESIIAPDEFGSGPVVHFLPQVDFSWTYGNNVAVLMLDATAPGFAYDLYTRKVEPITTLEIPKDMNYIGVKQLQAQYVNAHLMEFMGASLEARIEKLDWFQLVQYCAYVRGFALSYSNYEFLTTPFDVMYRSLFPTRRGWLRKLIKI